VNKRKRKAAAPRDTFGAQYIVKLDYQKPDGMWVFGHEEDVFVPVSIYATGKNKHKAARAIALRKYKDRTCRIVSVTYA